MPSHFDRYKSNHSAKEIFDIVKDVKSYPEFLPWISGARISNEKENNFNAELLIRFKSLSHSYVSKVECIEPNETSSNYEVIVSLVKGPFKNLHTKWTIMPIDDEHCEIIFELDFKFKSVIFERMIGFLFESATVKMTKAFEERADQIY